MNNLSAVKTSMACYSIWSALVAFLLMAVSLWIYSSEGSLRNEMPFFMVLALFHGIFSIWFWQGKQLPHFIHTTIYSRLLLACVYWFSAWQVHKWGDTLNLPNSVLDGFSLYLIVQGTADLVGATASAVFVIRSKKQTSQYSGTLLNTKLNLEIKNRFFFALYMTALAYWMLFNTEGFLTFFYLPTTEFTGWGGEKNVPGPIHLIGVLVLMLAVYNLVAVKYRLMQLIMAGVRGGLFTCLFVLLLVATDVLHPITLLLPAVDLMSVGLILFYSFRFNKRV